MALALIPEAIELGSLASVSTIGEAISVSGKAMASEKILENI